MNQNNEDKKEASKYLGQRGKLLFHGKPVQATLPPNEKKVWDQVGDISELLNLPIGWNGNSMDDTCTLAEILKVGCYFYKKIIPIANHLRMDKLSFTNQVAVESVDKVVLNFKKNHELVKKTNMVHDELVDKFTSNLNDIVKKRQSQSV